jgi:hypothetical protein
MYVQTVMELVFVSCWYELVVRRRLVKLSKFYGGMGAGTVTFIVGYHVASVLQMLFVLLFTVFLSLSMFPSPSRVDEIFVKCIQIRTFV